MEILNSFKHDFVKFIYELAHVFRWYKYNWFNLESLLVEKCIIGMNSKDFKTELGGQ